MSIFRKLEKNLESIFENAFARVARKKLEPLELAHELESVLLESAVTDAEVPFAANIYHIRISPADYALLKPFIKELEEQLEFFVEEVCSRESLTLPGKTEVNIEIDDGIKPGNVSIIPELKKREAEELVHSYGELEKTQVLDIEEAARLNLSTAPCYLEDLKTGKKFFLNRFPARIGRIESNDVIIEDLTVSRVHAEIYREGKHFFIRDLESTNGTCVNGKPVSVRRLSDGDIITFGEAKMRWHLAQ